MCHLCQLPVPAAAKAAHERGLHHQAARQIAATALDRWRAHIAASAALPDPVLGGDSDADSVIFCDICTEAVPSVSYSRHLAARPHLILALEDQVFEENVRVYVDEEDLKLLEAPSEQHDGHHYILFDGDGSAAEKSDAKTSYTCDICELQVPSAYKPEHECSVHHRTRVALASAATRRISAYLHDRTPGVPGVERNIKMIELLKSYTGTDLTEKNDANEKDVEKEVDGKASQVGVKKRLTAKQYFTDIIPYLQYTEALYSLIIDDTEYVTIKNINGTCMRVHVANFNGISCNKSGDVHYDMKCRTCNGYNPHVSYSSKTDHDKLHVMSLGHIRRVLTPIDNVHGIRRIDNGQVLCVLCNAFMADHSVENHVFNDIYHTAYLAEALKLGRNFKESKDDLKIIIYSAPPVAKTNYMRDPVRNFDSVFNRNNFPLLFGGGNVHLSEPGGALFGASNQSTTFGRPASTGIGASTANTGASFGAGHASTGVFGASTASTDFGASTANTGASFGAGPANTGFRANTAGIGALSGTGPASTGVFGPSTASSGLGFGDLSAYANHYTGFGANPASTGFGASPVGTGFGASPAGTGFGASTANTGAFGATPASTGFGASTPNAGAFGAKPAGTGFGASPAGTGFGASTANTGALGPKPASTSVFGASTSSTGAFGAVTANNAYTTPPMPMPIPGNTASVTNLDSTKSGLFSSPQGNKNVTLVPAKSSATFGGSLMFGTTFGGGNKASGTTAAITTSNSTSDIGHVPFKPDAFASRNSETISGGAANSGSVFGGTSKSAVAGTDNPGPGIIFGGTSNSNFELTEKLKMEK